MTFAVIKFFAILNFWLASLSLLVEISFVTATLTVVVAMHKFANLAFFVEVVKN